MKIEEWQDDRGGDSEPEAAAASSARQRSPRKRAGARRAPNKFGTARWRITRHAPDRAAVRVHPKFQRRSASTCQPLGNRARSLDRVGVSRPQQRRRAAADHDDDDPGIDPPPRSPVGRSASRRAVRPARAGSRRRPLSASPSIPTRPAASASHEEEAVTPVLAPSDHGRTRSPPHRRSRGTRSSTCGSRRAQTACEDEDDRRAASPLAGPATLADEAPQRRSAVRTKQSEAGESKRDVLGNATVH